ncbi:hypothetical protein XA68_15232 [Ophiocordyceps unilateralis]|uniref:Protein kinase domain-containing protein n=1 Tax=Ophiocordyceps unilateralis TaxID=268505 RepID=A0A2A9P7A7_OPHUN|nr:hypothetical protein XA68_15232 [Ophiocordyceps unilateralis]
MSSSPEVDYEVVHYHHYRPPGVLKILESGNSAFIGEVDDFTVLKYPLEPGDDLASLEHEHQLLKIVGPHERIIALAKQGFTNDGLYLERASNGALQNFISGAKHHEISIQQRIAWCLEITEAVAYTHNKNVIHCDINPTNILLDEKLHIKLADFQGCLVDDTGQVLLHALVGEPCRYFCPREDDLDVSVKTDLFALGSTIHFILTGDEVASDIIAGEEQWNEKVRDRFASGTFPDHLHACTSITQKCWNQQYLSAEEVLQDIKEVEHVYGSDTTRNN